MTLTANTIRSSRGRTRPKKRVGRGNASGKGNYSARGMKGQKARSGGRGGLKVKGFKQSLQKIPKLRGFTSHKPQKMTVTLSTLEKSFENGQVVTPWILESKGVISDAKVGVKIVQRGTLSKKLEISSCEVSKGAKEAIEKLGGTIMS